MNIETLNNTFAIPGQLEFIEGRGGLLQASVSNPHAEALISVYGGQVLRYRPLDEEQDLLFLSDCAFHQQGKAIKGGIPVCWPWFGPDPLAEGRPAHGFVRNRYWEVIACDALDNQATRLVMGLDSNDRTRETWPHDFELRVEIRVGEQLEIALSTHNTGKQPFPLTQALHSYFRVGDIARAQVSGLEGKPYVDKLDAAASKSQAGALLIEGEVDRVYQQVSDELIVEDAVFERRIRITSHGSASTVVWNPWVDTAASMADLCDHEYRHMLCVETANAGEDVVEVLPGKSNTLFARLGVENDLQ